MINVLEVNNKIREVLSGIKLVGLVDYGEDNIINESQGFKPIQVAFQNTGFSGVNSEIVEYEYSVLFLDKVRENTKDLEQVQSKIATIIAELINKINRSENYNVASDSSQYVVVGNDKLHGYDLTISIAVFNPEQIC